MNSSVLASALLRLPPIVRYVVASAMFGYLFPRTVTKIFPEEKDGLPIERIRMAVRREFERRIDSGGEACQRGFRVVLPDNFQLACIATSLILDSVKLKPRLRDIGLLSYSVVVCTAAFHHTRELTYIFGRPLLRSFSLTAPFADCLRYIAPSDVRQTLEKNAAFARETEKVVSETKLRAIGSKPKEKASDPDWDR